MAKTKYKATDANGKVHTRQTERTYTHTVVVQLSKAHAIATAKEATKMHRKNFQWHKDAADMGEQAYVERELVQWPTFGAPYFARQHQEHVKIVREFGGDVEAAVAAKLADRLAEIEATDWTEWHNAGWCGRLDLAQKLASSQSSERRIAATAILEAERG